MTQLLKLTCATLIVLTPLMASAQSALLNTNGFGASTLGAPPPVLRTVEVPSLGPVLGARGAAPQTAGPNTDFCGTGDQFYWYEEDANGNEIDGTRQYGCDYD